MPQRITRVVAPARLGPYRHYWRDSYAVEPSDAAVAAMYAWQTALAGAWVEVISHTEIITRNAIDLALRDWNTAKGCGPEWLQNPHQDLEKIMGKTLMNVRDQADRARRARQRSDPSLSGTHPRRGLAVDHNDLVAQLTFGNLGSLLPTKAPTARGTRESGYSIREHLWRDGLNKAFPSLPSVWNNKRWSRIGSPSNVPADVLPAYALGAAMERLRKIRNRVGHHEQTLRVKHVDRHKDALIVVQSISPEAAHSLAASSRLLSVLAMQPCP